MTKRNNAKILTTQADMDAVFARMERDYGALSKKQQAYAIREIGRVRGEISDMLADYAGKDGVIKRQRMSRILRDLDGIEASLRRNGTLALEGIIEETSEWTTKRVAGAGISLSASQFDRVNKHVVKYVTKRFGKDGLVLSDRIWGMSGEIRDDITKIIRSGIIKGEGINKLVTDIRPIFEKVDGKETARYQMWKVRRLARNESVTAHRAAISYNAQESDTVKWLQFHAGGKQSDECVTLAGEDKYGKGAGIFKPSDVDLFMPHVNCTGYATYVLDERWL